MTKSHALSLPSVTKPYLFRLASNFVYLTTFTLVAVTTSLVVLNTAEAADAMAEKESIKIGFDQDALIIAPDSQSPFFDKSPPAQGITEARSSDNTLIPITEDKITVGPTQDHEEITKKD